MKPNQIVTLQAVALATMTASEIVDVIRAHHAPFALVTRRAPYVARNADPNWGVCDTYLAR